MTPAEKLNKITAELNALGIDIPDPETETGWRLEEMLSQRLTILRMTLCRRLSTAQQREDREAIQERLEQFKGW